MYRNRFVLKQLTAVLDDLGSWPTLGKTAGDFDGFRIINHIFHRIYGIRLSKSS